MIFYKLIFNFFSALLFVFFANSSASENNEPYDFPKIFYSNHMDEYTLICLDSSLLPSDEFKSEELKELYTVRHWINQTFLKEKKDGIKLGVKNLFINDKTYYTILLEEQDSVTKAEKLTRMIMGDEAEATPAKVVDDFKFKASMILFTSQIQDHRALVYGFGKWKKLINEQAIVRDWGLRISANNKIFNSDFIKEIAHKTYRCANPSSKKEWKSKPDNINTFNIEVGSEGLEQMRICPQYHAKRVTKGADFYKFSCPKEKNKRGSDKSQEKEDYKNKHLFINDLLKLSSYFDKIYNEQSISSELISYIDKQVEDQDLIKKLNENLDKLLGAEQKLEEGSGKYFVFPHETIWKGYGSSPTFELKGIKTNNIRDFLRSKKISLHDEIKIFLKKESAQWIISQLIYTLPIEYDKNKFYRFDRGQWFDVDESRFKKIINALRPYKVDSETLNLPPYIDNAPKKNVANQKNEKKLDYPELRYNKSIIDKNPSSFLLDRKNVNLGGKGDCFEFADIFLEKNGYYYLIHVKRAEAGDIDHHRTQVERCAEYLAGNLNRKNLVEVFANLAIEKIMNNYNDASEKMDFFQKRIKKINKNEIATNKIIDLLLCEKNIRKKNVNAKTLINNMLEFKKQHLDILKKYNDYPECLAKVLDALTNYIGNTQEDKNGLSDDFIMNFLQTVLNYINMGNVFSDNEELVKKLKKITIVMAVIDDRKTKDTSLFHKQQLWGLDHTRTIVQRHGFNFNITVINENKNDMMDALGDIDPNNIQIPAEPSTGLKPIRNNDRVKIEDDDLINYDYRNLNIRCHHIVEGLPIRDKAINTTDDNLGKTYKIKGITFRKQNVSGAGMRCFFNSMGLKFDEEIIKLKRNRNDPIVRYMIANEIVSAAESPDQLPQEVKTAINYDLYSHQRQEYNRRAELRSEMLRIQNPDGNQQNTGNLPQGLRDLNRDDNNILQELRERAESLNSFYAFLNHHIDNENMMVALQDVSGEAQDNSNANYTSIDAIAYINKLGIRIYQPGTNNLRLAHEFIPEGATEIAYLYHDAFHFQALQKLIEPANNLWAVEQTNAHIAPPCPNQQFNVTEKKVAQVVKYLYEQNKKNKSKTANDIKVNDTKVSRGTVQNLMDNKAKKTWKKVAKNLATPEKVQAYFKGNFNNEQINFIINTLK